MLKIMEIPASTFRVVDIDNDLSLFESFRLSMEHILTKNPNFISLTTPDYTSSAAGAKLEVVKMLRDNLEMCLAFPKSSLTDKFMSKFFNLEKEENCHKILIENDIQNMKQYITNIYDEEDIDGISLQNCRDVYDFLMKWNVLYKRRRYEKSYDSCLLRIMPFLFQYEQKRSEYKRKHIIGDYYEIIIWIFERREDNYILLNNYGISEGNIEYAIKHPVEHDKKIINIFFNLDHEKYRPLIQLK